MATIISKDELTFGSDLPPDVKLSYAGFPPFVKIRVRLRVDEFAQAFTRHADGSTKHWYVKINKRGVVQPAFAQPCAMNLTAVPQRNGRVIKRRILSLRK